MTTPINGMPSMMTRAMRRALLARGISDIDITNMTPGQAHEILRTPDEAAVRAFLETFVTLALRSLAGHKPPGVLQMCRRFPDDKDVSMVRYALDHADAIERMTRDALADSRNGMNVYLEGRLVRPGLGRKRGELNPVDTPCVFALVVDSDGDKDMAWSPPAGTTPSITVETSPGNEQFWFFLGRAAGAERAKQMGERLRLMTGADADTGNPAQPYRLAGTVNYPGRVKAARGRVITPTLLIGALL